MSKTDGSQRAYHYIYKVTRTDGSGKYYIGMHSSDEPNDRYFGSGTVISSSIKKYGRKNHVKEVLEYYPTRAKAKDREVELVNKELLNDPLCMNIAYGGQGFNGAEVQEWWQNPEYRTKVLERQAAFWAKTENRKAQSELKKKQYEDQSLRDRVGESSKIAWSDPTKREAQSERKKKHWQEPELRDRMLQAQAKGKDTDECRAKWRAAKLGEKNATYGTRWIHSDQLKKSTMLKKTEPLPDGWREGRKMYVV